MANETSDYRTLSDQQLVMAADLGALIEMLRRIKEALDSKKEKA